MRFLLTILIAVFCTSPIFAISGTSTTAATFADSASLDAFGRVRTSGPGQRLDVEFLYDLQDEFFDAVTNNGGRQAPIRKYRLSRPQTSARPVPALWSPGSSRRTTSRVRAARERPPRDPGPVRLAAQPRPSCGHESLHH